MASYNSIYPYQNPYLTYGYNQPYPQIQQPAPQPAPALMAPTQAAPQSSIIWVSGDKEAAMYPIAPNAAVTLWSQSEPVVYLKQADASGKPVLKTFDLVERADEAPRPAERTEEYATKTDLTAVIGVMNNYKDAISALKSDLETIKGDMYGIAGKKKAPKKTTEEADEG